MCMETGPAALESCATFRPHDYSFRPWLFWHFPARLALEQRDGINVDDHIDARDFLLFGVGQHGAQGIVQLLAAAGFQQQVVAVLSLDANDWGCCRPQNANPLIARIAKPLSKDT